MGNPAVGDKQNSTERRIQRLSSHLATPSLLKEHQLALVQCAKAKLPVSSDLLSNYMRGKHREIQERVFKFFNDRPDLQTPVEIMKDDHRELCMRQLLGLVREAKIKPFRYLHDDPAKYFAVAEAVGTVDMSIGIKMGVQYSLWGGSVINLGTKKHKDKYYEGIDNLDYPGCFAMTELHHATGIMVFRKMGTVGKVPVRFFQRYSLRTKRFMEGMVNQGWTEITLKIIIFRGITYCPPQFSGHGHMVRNAYYGCCGKMGMVTKISHKKVTLAFSENLLLIRRLTSGCCFWEKGSNVQGIQTVAKFDPITDEFVIDTPNDGAIKWWIGNAAVHGKFATVFAKLILPTHNSKEGSDMGVHAFIVPIRDMKTHHPLPGIEIQDCGHKVGLNGVDNGALKFCAVRIPRDNLLNRFGEVSRDGKYTSSLPTISKRFAATLGELVGGRVGLAYSSVGVIKIAVTIAVRYSLLRQQFGPPKQPEIRILDYQSQQHKLMPMLASTYAFHFATLYLVEKYSEMKKSHDEQVVGDVHALSAGLKAYVTSYTAKSLSICREACGGHGYAAVNRFGSLRNDHDIFQTFEGDNTVLLQQVAADLLKQYKEKFQGGALTVTWSYLRESMGSYLSQPNPVTTRREGEDHLRDPSFQLDAFRYRTSRLLQSVAVRLRKHTKTLGSFGAWNRCLNHLLTLAESHIESVILAKFIEAVQSCPDENTRAVLKLVCDLYALDRIWNDIGTYRNVDYVAPNKAKAIHKLTEYLSFQVRNVARELVDAFDLPDHVTRAPIGMQSEPYAHYTHYVGF